KRFGVVPGCCTSWSRRSPRQLRAVGRSLRSGRGALCRSAVRRSDLGPAATPRGDGSAAACLPCGHGDDAAVWILALPDQRRAACDGRHRLGGPQLVGDEVWWTEGIATEEGRNAIVRTDGPV